MPKFSQHSTNQLATCDHRLQKLFNEVIKHFDCRVLEGHRGAAKQDAAFMRGASKVKFPNSKHNSRPSMAVDVAPYPVIWPNKDDKDYVKQVARYYMLSFFVMGIASQMGIKIRSGADWDGDKDIFDQTFDDLVHFEIDES
jgi:peptidoglycan L-alanyl-D-glutamate endopeptidase CwlK